MNSTQRVLQNQDSDNVTGQRVRIAGVERLESDTDYAVFSRRCTRMLSRMHDYPTTVHRSLLPENAPGHSRKLMVQSQAVRYPWPVPAASKRCVASVRFIVAAQLLCTPTVACLACYDKTILCFSR
jgi:hypothetical protein